METDKGQGDLNFTDEQQTFINKLMGKTRISAREKEQVKAAEAAKTAKDAAEQAKLEADKEWQKLAAKHEARVKELEPLAAQAAVYSALIEDMLSDKVKALGDKAKKAVAGLPESLSTLDKLNWLNQNEELFKTEEKPGGSPKGHQKPSTKGKVADRVETRRRKTL